MCGDIESLRHSVKATAPDVVIGGPPCQGFSVAGHMRPDDPRSNHVQTFIETVSELRPTAFVMENVAALAMNKRWSGVLDGLRKTAASQGYETTLWVLNAADYGVPQARLRMFLIGSFVGLPQAPATTTADEPLTVRRALCDLPEYGLEGNDSRCAAIVTPAKNPVLRRSPYAGMLFNGKGRPLNLDAPAPTLPASMGGNRTPVLDQLELDGLESQSWIIGYHDRLWRGKKPLKRIPRRMRRLTVQEAARIQSFPATWTFSGTQSSQFRQIGNAVPPELASHVATVIRSTLRSSKNEPLVSLAA